MHWKFWFSRTETHSSTHLQFSFFFFFLVSHVTSYRGTFHRRKPLSAMISPGNALPLDWRIKKKKRMFYTCFSQHLFPRCTIYLPPPAAPPISCFLGDRQHLICAPIWKIATRFNKGVSIFISFYLEITSLQVLRNHHRGMRFPLTPRGFFFYPFKLCWKKYFQILKSSQ